MHARLAMQKEVIRQDFDLRQNNDSTKSVSEAFHLKSKVHKSTKVFKEEVDSIRPDAIRFRYYDILFTALGIISRLVSVYLNIKLAISFYQNGDVNYFWWTICCLLIPLSITSTIHCFMCYEDGKFRKGTLNTVKTCILVLLSSVFLRYWKPLVYAIRCKRAECCGDKASQLRFYKLAIREESDVAFLRLFECFLESAPQKILQISIVLTQKSDITYLQVIVICLQFGSMAWCLTVYHRYVRFSQEDKLNINLQGHVCHLCWHFCVSVSRTLCIAYVVSIFPLWTIVWCMTRALLNGSVIFIAARPNCPKATFPNIAFCFVFGIIYLFTYISTKDEPTRYKYLFYYTTCFLENIASIIIFIVYAPIALKSTDFIFYLLCCGAIAFYCLGILVMMVYYYRFHPQITARKSERLMINNS